MFVSSEEQADPGAGVDGPGRLTPVLGTQFLLLRDADVFFPGSINNAL